MSRAYLISAAWLMSALIGVGVHAGYRDLAKLSAIAESHKLEVADDEVYIDRATGLRMYDDKVFTGQAVSTFPNGNIHEIADFVNGRRHGALTRWFPTGQIAMSAQYENGRRHGSSLSWWDNGNLRGQASYVADQPDGEALSWYRDGQKFKKLSFRLGQPVGLQQGWRQNGKLFNNFEYRNGRAFGLRNSKLCFTLEDEEFIDGA